MQENHFMGKDGFHWFFGRVVNRHSDPLQLGRVRVRVFGLHTDDENLIQNDHLPWAIPIQPVTSAGIFGIGHSPLGLVEGSHVFGFFADGKDAQVPIVIGTIASGLGHLVISATDSLKKSEEEFATDIATRQTETLVNSVPGPAQGYIKGPIGQILDLIARFESRGSYTAVYSSSDNKDLTSYTIAEVIEYGNTILKTKGASPLGRYQITHSTLKDAASKAGISLTEKFSPEIQDKLCIQIMKTKGADPYKFYAGGISAEKCISSWSTGWSTWPSNPNNINALTNLGSNWHWDDLVVRLTNIKNGKT